MEHKQKAKSGFGNEFLLIYFCRGIKHLPLKMNLYPRDYHRNKKPQRRGGAKIWRHSTLRSIH